MKFDPPMLTRGPLSGRVYVVTHGTIMARDEQGREQICATRKYDVTDQFDALCREASVTETAKGTR